MHCRGDLNHKRTAWTAMGQPDRRFTLDSPCAFKCFWTPEAASPPRSHVTCRISDSISSLHVLHVHSQGVGACRIALSLWVLRYLRSCVPIVWQVEHHLTLVLPQDSVAQEERSLMNFLACPSQLAIPTATWEGQARIFMKDLFFFRTRKAAHTPPSHLGLIATRND